MPEDRICFRSEAQNLNIKKGNNKGVTLLVLSAQKEFLISGS